MCELEIHILSKFHGVVKMALKQYTCLKYSVNFHMINLQQILVKGGGVIQEGKYFLI